MPRSVSTVNDKSAVIIKDNKRGKREHPPLVAVVDAHHLQVENAFSMIPSKTEWGEEMYQKYLAGASEYELDKLEPISETELKRIFPNATATVMKDPLTSTDKTRIHDNVRRDPYTAVALFTHSYFMLGPESTITMGLNRKYATEERKKIALEQIMNNEEYLDILEDIMNRDDELDMQTRKLEMVTAGSAFGRSVQIRQYDSSNRVCRYIPLSSTRLGRVWVDKKTWEFLGVEYNDYTRDKRILLAKDVIHYECNDMVMTPRGRYYGMSMLEPLMGIGERNRVANEIALPEIFRKNWSPIMIVKVNTGSQTKLNEVRDAFSMPGKTVVYNDAIEVTVVPLSHDAEKVQSAIQEGAKDTFRGMTIPQGVGWSYDPNHATFEGSMLQWYNGTLAFKRSHLDAVMWQQHYRPQMEMIFKERMVTETPEQQYNYLIQNAPNTRQQLLPFRITTEFKNIKTVGFLEMATAILGFKNAGIVNNEIALRESGLEQYVDDMAEEEQKQVSLGNNLLMQEQNMEQQGEPVDQGIKGVLDVTRRSLTRDL